jgi:hypothetical protein
MALFQRSDRFRDLRKSPRHEVHYLAQIEIGGTLAPVSCIICDISGSGAKLTVGGQHQVPEEFTLLLRRRCRVVRRDDGQLGVQFV